VSLSVRRLSGGRVGRHFLWLRLTPEHLLIPKSSPIGVEARSGSVYERGRNRMEVANDFYDALFRFFEYAFSMEDSLVQRLDNLCVGQAAGRPSLCRRGSG
jgi:hypothetical protein